ncbi:MAG: helix-turn-helix domain-containing protein [Acidiferrobacterales bacterium]
MTHSEIFSIGVLASRTATNVETIRYYERVGLLPEPPRTAGGHRLYREDHLKQLLFIRRSRALGFTLEQVRVLVRLAQANDYSCDEVKAITREQLEHVRRKRADLKRLESVLAEMVAQCENGVVPACPVIDALYRADS